jgi:Domain of unknown function (DUF4326)
MPKRLQLSRRKGSRLPEDAINVARPGPWGNPFRVGDIGPDGETIETRAEAVALYRKHVSAPPPGHDYAELRGHDLACWCPLDGPCHADTLLERANPE